MFSHRSVSLFRKYLEVVGRGIAPPRGQHHDLPHSWHVGKSFDAKMQDDLIVEQVLGDHCRFFARFASWPDCHNPLQTLMRRMRRLCRASLRPCCSPSDGLVCSSSTRSRIAWCASLIRCCTLAGQVSTSQPRRAASIAAQGFRHPYKPPKRLLALRGENFRWADLVQGT
jgi:hypothetical protein